MDEREELKKQFKGKLIFPEDNGFGFPQTWNLYATKAKPAFIAFPNDVEDVQTLVKHCASHNIQMTARSGGHSVYSVRDNAVTVDMRNFKNVEVDQDTGIVTSQAGLLLGELDAKTAPWHVPVGVISHTGFGLVLGGGFGWLARNYGYTVDNVIEAKIVTADGELRTCNKKENSQLLWGILGAGSNLGILVEYKLQAYKVENVIVNGLAWPLSVDIVEKLHNFQVEHHENRKLTTYIFFTIIQGNFMAMVYSIFLGSKEEANTLFKPLMDLNPAVPLAPCVEMPFVKANCSLDNAAPSSWWYLTSVSFGGHQTCSIPREALKALVEEYRKVSINSASMMVIEQRGGKPQDFPINTTCHPHRYHDFDIVLGFACNEEENCPQVTVLTRNTRERIKQILKKEGKLWRGVYNNMNNRQFNIRAEEAYLENLPQLVEIKKKYDPANVFCGNVDLGCQEISSKLL